jgi:uncharacterized protein (TIGR03435 family)
VRLGLLLALIAVAGFPLSSQALRFDVASIRSSANRVPVADYVFLPGGQFRAANATVEELILAAYDIARFRVAGGPAWIRTSQYDVQTRAGADITMEQSRAMLRTLLEDRFRLRARIVSRDVPIYVLALNRRDGRTGPRLRPSSSASCVDRGPLPINVPPGAPPSCGRLLGNVGRLFGWRVPIDMLAARLERLVDRPVVDTTELTGQMFDVELEWAAEAAPGNADKPGLFTALVEQSGLKLEATQGGADVLVIDHVEPLSAD